MTTDDAPAHQTSPDLALGPIQATVIALALCARLGLEPAQAGLVRLVTLLGWAAFISLVLLSTTPLSSASVGASAIQIRRR